MADENQKKYGRYNYYYGSNTLPAQEQVQVTQAATANGGTTQGNTSGGATTAANETTAGSGTVLIQTPNQGYKLVGKPEPTSRFGRVWEASKKASSFMGDDDYMSRQEQRQWRKAYGIDKRTARLQRRSLNYGAKAYNTSDKAEKAKYNALSDAYGARYYDSYVYPAAVEQYNTQVGEELAKQAAYEKELPGLLKYAAHTAWDEGLKDKYTWEEDSAWNIAWGDGDKTKHAAGTSLGVQNLQKYLNTLDSSLNLAEDGAWGPKTAAAVTKRIAQIKDPQERQMFINSVNAALALQGLKRFGNDTTTYSDVSEADKLSWANNHLFKNSNFKLNNYQEGYNKYKNNPAVNGTYSITAWKNGGKMKINYFQEGGAVTQPTQQPAASAEDIQTQVVQLVQAAMQGDEKAAQTVQQIMQAADQGDEQAVQIAQMIKDIIQQMQGQAKAAKRGAKLSYIHSLKTGCPEGYSASYYQKGGHICKECLKNKLAEEQKKSEAPKSACGSKLSKGNLKRKLCAGKKLAEGDKLTPKGGQVNNQIPFNKRGNKAKQSYTSKFNAARARHERYFWYNGKTYNTLKAGEDPKEWAAKFEDNLTAGGSKSNQYDVGKSGGWEGVKGAKAGRYNSKGEWVTFDENAGHERTAVPQSRGDEKPNGYRGYLPVDKPTDEVVVVGKGSDRGKTTANLTTGVVIGQTPQYEIVVTPKHPLVNGKAVSTAATVTKANPREYGTSEPSDADYNYFPMGHAGSAGGTYVVNPFLTPRQGKNTK